MKSIAFYTLGCKANRYQTECLKSQLLNDELQLAPFENKADIYVINTCTVTEDADRKSRQAIRRALRQNPEAKVIVAGCYAILEGEKLKQHFPRIEFIEANPLGALSPPHSPQIRAELMIQDGCEQDCSYCIVPYARGKFESKPIEPILIEAKQLLEAGAREIILTGINLGTYQFGLPEVINQLSILPNLYRIRLSSIEPMYLTKELINTVAENPKVCKHLHLPLQSGDDHILRAMHRPYTSADFLEMAHSIRNKIPDCGITTDIIVGFPGEGEKEFQNTVDLVNQIKFSRMHIFSYSKREKTPASNLKDQVDTKTKKQRNKILQELRLKYMCEFALKYLNKELEILVEQKGEGVTSNYIRCYFNDAQDSSGSLRNICARTITVEGEIRG